MNIGFRADEAKRVKKYDGGCKLNKISYSQSCNLKSGRNSWVHDHYWRDINFPLYSQGITKKDVVEFISKTGLVFPEISNCSYCFFHRTEEHIKQFQQNPEQAQPWLEMEEFVSKYYNKDYSFAKGHKLGDILKGKKNNPGTSGCMCTD